VTLADMENIKINQLSFSYEDNGKLILKDINIEVQGENLSVFWDNPGAEKAHFCACWPAF
jgi:NitT/TauT family transport system ATP-binding protein